MLSNPKISIVIPVYNGSNFLAEAIESAISQTYNNIEVIVVNDGSNDDQATQKVALKYKDRIKYYEKKNGGVASALNLGLSKMQGEYFCWLSHDDVFDREKTEIQLAYMQERNLSFTYGDYRFIDQEGRLIKDMEAPYYDRLEAMKMLLINGYIHGCSIMVKRELFNKTGLFNEDYKHTQDTDMWFRMSMILELKRIPRVLLSSRIHDNQTSKLYTAERRAEMFNFYEIALQNQILQDYLFRNEIDISSSDNEAFKKSALLSWMGDKLMYINKNYSWAIHFYRQSIETSSKNRFNKNYKLLRSRILSIVIEKGLNNVKDFLRSFSFVANILSKIR